MDSSVGVITQRQSFVPNFGRYPLDLAKLDYMKLTVESAPLFYIGVVLGGDFFTASMTRITVTNNSFSAHMDMSVLPRIDLKNCS